MLPFLLSATDNKINNDVKKSWNLGKFNDTVFLLAREIIDHHLQYYAFLFFEWRNWSNWQESRRATPIKSDDFLNKIDVNFAIVLSHRPINWLFSLMIVFFLVSSRYVSVLNSSYLITTLEKFTMRVHTTPI